MMDEDGNAQTVDGEHLIDVFGNFAIRNGHEWLDNFNCYDGISGGKFNIWLTPTQWPRKPWNEAARDFASKLKYRWGLYETRMRVRGCRARKNQEKMRHYYGVV